MKTTTKLAIVTIALISALTLNVSAQKIANDLQLTAHGQHASGLYVEISGDKFALKVSGLDIDARVYIAGSPIQTLGELDLKTAQLLGEGRSMFAGEAIKETYAVPAHAADLLGISVQAFAVDNAGNLHASNVMTIIFVETKTPTKSEPGSTTTADQPGASAPLSAAKSTKPSAPFAKPQQGQIKSKTQGTLVQAPHASAPSYAPASSTGEVGGNGTADQGK